MTTLITTKESSFINTAIRLVRSAINTLQFLTPVGDLLVRLWVANVFWKSGLTKFESFDTTILLFENEYQVPFISPVLAAYFGTFTELFFPVLLVLGLAGRMSAGVLFIFNIIAVASYPDLGPAGVAQHQVWGILLLITLMHGPGKLSLDHWISKRWFQS
jgi:putative oxidoreductase